MEDEKEKNICSRYACGRPPFPSGLCPGVCGCGGIFLRSTAGFRIRTEFFPGDEAEELNEKLDEISHDQEFDVTAALVNSLGGSSVQDYADDLYDMCDFGYGADRDGVLLLVSPGRP